MGKGNHWVDWWVTYSSCRRAMSIRRSMFARVWSGVGFGIVDKSWWLWIEWRIWEWGGIESKRSLENEIQCFFLLEGEVEFRFFLPEDDLPGTYVCLNVWSSRQIIRCTYIDIHISTHVCMHAMSDWLTDWWLVRQTANPHCQAQHEQHQLQRLSSTEKYILYIHTYTHAYSTQSPTKNTLTHVQTLEMKFRFPNRKSSHSYIVHTICRNRSHKKADSWIVDWTGFSGWVQRGCLGWSCFLQNASQGLARADVCDCVIAEWEMFCMWKCGWIVWEAWLIGVWGKKKNDG